MWHQMRLFLKDCVNSKQKRKEFLEVSDNMVYFFYDTDGNIVYIGRSLDGRINGRLRVHRKNEIFNHVHEIRCVLFSEQIEATIYEMYWINRVSPKYNTEVFTGQPPLELDWYEPEVYWLGGKNFADIEEDNYSSLSKLKLSTKPLPKPVEFPIKGRLDYYKNTYIGSTFSNLVIKDVIKDNNTYRAICDCKLCNNTKSIGLSHVINKKILSCGCLNKLHQRFQNKPFYINLSLETNIPIDEVYLWWRKYSAIIHTLKYKGMSYDLSFKEFITDILEKNITLENVGYTRGGWKFNHSLLEFVKRK